MTAIDYALFDWQNTATNTTFRAQNKVSNRNQIVRFMLLSAIGAVLSIKIYLMGFVIDPFIGAYGVATTSLVFTAFLFAFTKYTRPSTINASRHLLEQPLVTAIIPAKNEPILIRSSATSVLGSTYNKVEVILVNDGSDDKTGQVIEEIRNENPERVKVIHLEKNMGKRKAIREAFVKGDPKGGLILLMDSDTVVDKFSIAKLVRAFDNPDVGAATGHTLALNANENMLTRMQDTWYDGQYYIMKGMESFFNSVTCCPGTLSAYRKEAIIPCLDAWCNDKFLGVEFRPGDDRHLTSYVLGGTRHYIDDTEKAWKVVYCEDALAHTEVPSSLKKFINQQIRWKKSWIRSLLFNVPFYYKGRHIIPTFWHYTQMILSLVTPFVAFRALVLLPMEGRNYDAIFYCLGLAFVGFIFAITYKLRHPEKGNRWLYRLVMPPISILLNFLTYYSILTVRKNSWLTR